MLNNTDTLITTLNTDFRRFLDTNLPKDKSAYDKLSQARKYVVAMINTCLLPGIQPKHNPYLAKFEQCVSQLTEASDRMRFSKNACANLHRVLVRQGTIFGSNNIIKLLNALLRDRVYLEDRTEKLRPLYEADPEFFKKLDIRETVGYVRLTAGLCALFEHNDKNGRCMLSETESLIASALMDDYCAQVLHVSNVFPVSVHEGYGGEEWLANPLKWGRDPYGQARWMFVARFRDYVVMQAKD